MFARRKPSPDSVAQHAAAILEPTGPTGKGEGEEIGAGGGKGAAEPTGFSGEGEDTEEEEEGSAEEEEEEEGLQWYVFRNLDLKPGRKWDADFVDYGKHFRSPAEVIEEAKETCAEHSYGGFVHVPHWGKIFFKWTATEEDWSFRWVNTQRIDTHVRLTAAKYKEWVRCLQVKHGWQGTDAAAAEDWSQWPGTAASHNQIASSPPEHMCATWEASEAYAAAPDPWSYCSQWPGTDAEHNRTASSPPAHMCAKYRKASEAYEASLGYSR